MNAMNVETLQEIIKRHPFPSGPVTYEVEGHTHLAGTVTYLGPEPTDLILETGSRVIRPMVLFTEVELLDLNPQARVQIFHEDAWYEVEKASVDEEDGKLVLVAGEVICC